MALWKQSANARKWAPFLASTEKQFGIPSDLLARVAYQESHYATDIIDGTRPGGAGELGMMQLMPQYFLSARRAVPFNDSDTQDQIVEAAGALVSHYSRFGDWPLAVAAYNDGEGNVHQYTLGKRSLPASTIDYVTAVFADVPNAGNVLSIIPTVA